MGATYTRQSSSGIVDGGVIEATDLNNEFDQLLAAFAVSSGHSHDGTAAEGGPITKLLGNTLTFGAATAGTDITVTFDGESNDGVFKWMEDEDYFEFSDDLLVASTEKLQFRDTAIYINSSADGQLDLVADTEIQIAATTIDINGNVDVSGTLTVAGAVDFGDAALSNVGAVQLDSIAGDGDTNTSITFSGSDVITITAGGDAQFTFNNGSIVPSTDNDIDLGTSSLEFKDAYFDGTVHADAINFNGTAISATAAELNIMDGVTSTAAELNLVDGITAGTVSASKAVIVDSNKDLTGFRNLTISGDLTVSGDDITMGTNTAGNILVADGTNFNSIAVGGLSEISTVANDDVFLAVDTSGGGLKRIARSAIVSGLATSSAISNVVEDTTPQLGGNLDMNGADIVTTSNADLELAPNGTGHVTVRGNTNSGAIQFNCESNSHGQIVIAQPHSAAVTNTLTLPAGSSSTLVSLVSTDTLTNKTLTSPKINEDVAVTSTATELNVLDGITAVVGELNALDIGATAIGTAVASKAVILDANKDYTGFRNITLSGELDAGSLDVSGDADIDGTLEADAITVAGVALATFVRDTVGTNMLSSNTESGIAVTYDTTNDNIDFAINAAQTGITSLLATDIKIGEDDQTKIDFETADEIHFYAANVEQVYLGDNIFGPQSDSDVDLGSTGVRWKDAFVDSITVTGEIDGASLDISGNADIDGTLETDALSIASTTVTSTAAELNILDGVTSTAAELNYSDLATLGTTAASKVFTADANGLTKVSGAVLNTEDTLTDGSTIAWDVIASPVAKVTLGGNRTFAAPSGTTPAAGQFVSLLLIQDGTGSRTITWNAVYEFAADTAPTLTTTANLGDLFVFRYNGAKWLEVGRNLALTLS